jgi:hypothetical protein
MENQKRKTCIKIEKLPLRPTIITPGDYEKIFGGSCLAQGAGCGTTCDSCCPGLICQDGCTIKAGTCIPG